MLGACVRSASTPTPRDGQRAVVGCYPRRSPVRHYSQKVLASPVADSADLSPAPFAHPGASTGDINVWITTLLQGYKDIIAMLNRGQFVLTDWVPLRNASTQQELDFLNSEAFTFRSQGEGMDVVYVESSFFVDHPGNVLAGQKNWTRILIHELSHLVAGTRDIVNGRTRYAWYGIGPHAGYPGGQCVQNADNWAFFAVDCGGTMTDSERSTALRIV